MYRSVSKLFVHISWPSRAVHVTLRSSLYINSTRNRFYSTNSNMLFTCIFQDINTSLASDQYSKARRFLKVNQHLLCLPWIWFTLSVVPSCCQICLESLSSHLAWNSAAFGIKQCSAAFCANVPWSWRKNFSCVGITHKCCASLKHYDTAR